MRYPKDDGATLIQLERGRQIDGEDWTADHDDTHNDAEMGLAARAYIQVASFQARNPGKQPLLMPDCWPWGDEWWKPSLDPIRNLAKAGALVAAEIDRLLRVSQDADAFAQNRAIDVEDTDNPMGRPPSTLGGVLVSPPRSLEHAMTKTAVTISIDSSIASATDAYTLGLLAEQQFMATHTKTADSWKLTTSESSHAGRTE